MSRDQVFVPRQRGERGGQKGATLRVYRQRAAREARLVAALLPPPEETSGDEK